MVNLDRIATLTDEEAIALERALSPKRSEYWPHEPTPRQTAFLLLDCLEAMYGGAAGGGKSDAILMAALQYVDVPGYAALILRRTFQDLALPDAIMDRAAAWLAPTDAVWSEAEKTWTFPSGATLTFGYLQSDKDRYRYQSAQFQFIGFDELTQFTERQYRYLFSRLRRLGNVDVPLRMRSASNPGGVGHLWVKQRFIVEGKSHKRIFIPAKLQDNPHLDQVEYRRALMELDPVTRAQLLGGDWTARTGGTAFRAEWFPLVSKDDVPWKQLEEVVRYWDCAATVPKDDTDPDYTAGVKLGVTDDRRYYILDIVRFRGTPHTVELRILETAIADGLDVDIFMEQEPGASGKQVTDHFLRDVLDGWTFRGDPATGSKESRAKPVSSQAEAGNLYLVIGDYVVDFLDEAESWGNEAAHKDQIDALSGAFAKLQRYVGDVQYGPNIWA